ncbi:hypothetical protein [Chloroflexus sp.]|uniref:hypothetical protein n=1 Tax=Chloroflexus sp. TaxID=1904827 RepID=UPI003C76DB6A
MVVPKGAIHRPTTRSGISNVTSELLGSSEMACYGLDSRELRVPGLISATPPSGGGTTH